MTSQVTSSYFKSCMAYKCGQSGWQGSAVNTTFEDCGHEESNWKRFDFGWNASTKFSQTHYCMFVRWKALNCYGTGLWFDITNTNNQIVDPYIYNCVRVGIELELGASNNRIVGGMIDTIRAEHSPDQKKSSWTIQQSAAIVVKAGSNGNTADDLSVKNCEKAVWIDNTDPRGVSYNNEFRIIEMGGIDMPLLYLPTGSSDMKGNKYTSI
jgi:hypothetical protein